MLRLSDLIAAEVRDANDNVLGEVEDVVFVQSPDIAEGSAPPLVLTELMVAKPGRGRIHAFVHPDVSGPKAIRMLAHYLMRHAVMVRWADVAECTNGCVRLKPGAKKTKFHQREEEKTKSSGERRR